MLTLTVNRRAFLAYGKRALSQLSQDQVSAPLAMQVLAHDPAAVPHGSSQQTQFTGLLTHLAGFCGDCVHLRHIVYHAFQYCQAHNLTTLNIVLRYSMNTKPTTIDISQRFRCYSLFLEAMLRRAISPKPCELCGEVNTEAHHEDYSRPLAVQWLCHSHHDKADVARRERLDAARPKIKPLSQFERSLFHARSPVGVANILTKFPYSTTA